MNDTRRVARRLSWSTSRVETRSGFTGSSRVALGIVSLKQFDRLESQAFGDTLDGSKREVTLASLDRTHVCAVYSEQSGEGFLRDTTC